MSNRRTKKVIVVLISGKMGVGKTTAANMVVGKLKDSEVDVKKLSLASTLKEIATLYMFWDGEKDADGRELLQTLGDVGRKYFKNVWCRCLEEREILSKTFPPNIIVIDDWRYPNELAYFKDRFLYDVISVRVEGKDRSGVDDSNKGHVSEISLPVSVLEYTEYIESDTYNFCILNAGDKNDLEDKLGGLVSYIKTKII